MGFLRENIGGSICAEDKQGIGSVVVLNGNGVADPLLGQVDEEGEERVVGGWNDNGHRVLLRSQLVELNL